MSELRQAILRAADWIEKNPSDYSFGSCEVPECGTPGCMVGWIGHFLGIEKGKHFVWDYPCNYGERGITPIIGCHAGTFINRIRPLVPRQFDIYANAKHAAIALRAYAEKYHPSSTPSGASVCELIMSKPFREPSHERA